MEADYTYTFKINEQSRGLQDYLVEACDSISRDLFFKLRDMESNAQFVFIDLYHWRKQCDHEAKDLCAPLKWFLNVYQIESKTKLSEIFEFITKKCNIQFTWYFAIHPEEKEKFVYISFGWPELRDLK